jgi:hypothetical protein
MPTYDEIKSAFANKNYKFYVGDLNLNVFGVRKANGKTNLFDDSLGVVYEHHGSPIVNLWSATTDPGLPWLENPLNAKGAAILVPGQYPVYSIDYHRGAYKALCQRRGPVKVYRDGNRNATLDYDPKTITTGDYGINIHRASRNGRSVFVDRNSAGCQVFADSTSFDNFMSICYAAEKRYGNKFTYTLFDEKDFPSVG